MQRPPLWTKDFLMIALSNFFMFLSFYMLLPTLPIYVVDVLKGSEDQVGLIIGVFTVAAVIFRPLTGKWVDQWGRRNIFYIALFLFFAGMVMYAGVRSMFLLLALRFFHGSGFGIATTAAGAIVADIVPASRRGEGMGYYGVFNNIAMAIGPFIGIAVIGGYSFTILFMLCAALALIGAIFALFINIPELKMESPRQEMAVVSSMPSDASRRSSEKRPFQWRDYIESSAVPMSIVHGLLAVVYGGIASFVLLYAQQIGAADAAGYFFTLYAGALFLSRTVAGRIYDRRGPNVVIYPGLVIFIIGMLMLSQATGPALLLASGVFIGFGFGVISPSLQALVIQSVPANRRGTATATLFTFFDIGIGFGSFVLGLIAASAGYRSIYMVSAGFIVVAGVLYYVLQGRQLKRMSAEHDS